MKEKFKILSVGAKKMNRNDERNWSALVDQYVPDMYTNFFSVGVDDTLKQVICLRPEIVLLSARLRDPLSLLKRIKQIHATTVIFVLLNMVDEDQETIDEFMSAGAYKCYLPPIIIDSLAHDMHVALNLE